MSTCCVEGCGKETYHKGLRKRGDGVSSKYCRVHYRWITERGTLEPGSKARLPLEQRFWRKVEIKGEDECWMWLGGKNPKGYGGIGAGGVDGKRVLAHRLSYQMFYGPIPKGAMILHECDNPSCVNPRHLRHGTGSENIKEAYDKGRKFVPCNFGENNPRSKLTLEQAKFIKSNPQLGNKQIADMFGLSPNCIRGVRIGRTWKEA
jgi:hypothetical protein